MSEIVWPFAEKGNPLLLRIEPKFRGRAVWIMNYRENSEIMDQCKKKLCRITVEIRLYLVYKTSTFSTIKTIIINNIDNQLDATITVY